MSYRHEPPKLCRICNQRMLITDASKKMGRCGTCTRELKITNQYEPGRPPPSGEVPF